jgi:hypothetical protein
LFSQITLSSIDLSSLPTWLVVVLGALVLVGVLGVAVGGWIFLEDLGLSIGPEREHVQFEGGPVDSGWFAPDLCDEEAIRGLAAHHKVKEPPSKIESSWRANLSLNPLSWVGLSGERSKVETREPRNDMGELIRAIVGHLDEQAELNRVGRIHIDDFLFESIPSFHDPNVTRETFESWLQKNYPDGVDGVKNSELAEKLATIGTEIPDGAVRERLKEALEAVKASEHGSVLFSEGEWSVEGDEGDLLLTRTDVQVVASIRPTPPRSVPMPDGITIKARLTDKLTDHGKRRLGGGVSLPVRASILATVRTYDPGNCCLELTPIAVVQRVGST